MVLSLLAFSSCQWWSIVLNAKLYYSSHLSRHEFLEHDVSLSRVDAYFGNASTLSPAIFSQTTKFWNKETLTAEMLANFKLARMIESSAFDPEHTSRVGIRNLLLVRLWRHLLCLAI